MNRFWRKWKGTYQILRILLNKLAPVQSNLSVLILGKAFVFRVPYPEVEGILVSWNLSYASAISLETPLFHFMPWWQTLRVCLTCQCAWWSGWQTQSLVVLGSSLYWVFQGQMELRDEGKGVHSGCYAPRPRPSMEQGVAALHGGCPATSDSTT